MSGITGLADLDAWLERYPEEIRKASGPLIEDQARATQADLVNMVPHRTGRAIEALASSEALAFEKDEHGVTVKASVGLLTLDLQRKAFYLFFLEKGRRAYDAGAFRFAGIDKRYAKVPAERQAADRDARKWKRVKRNIGAMTPRMYFRLAYTRLAERMTTARGLSKLKTFVEDQFNNR